MKVSDIDPNKRENSAEQFEILLMRLIALDFTKERIYSLEKISSNDFQKQLIDKFGDKIFKSRGLGIRSSKLKALVEEVELEVYKPKKEFKKAMEEKELKPQKSISKLMLFANRLVAKPEPAEVKLRLDMAKK